MKDNATKTSAILSAAVLATLGLGQAASANSSDSLFSAVQLDRGYMLTASEGKCGEGKCGGDSKDGEGKCGEGKCGDDSKDAEGKCGEGKCGLA
jgi:uncharacterized low-complexity protein